VKKHKSIIIFLIKFFVTYFLLVTIYNTYLQRSQEKEGVYKTASITTLVADQTVKVLTFFDYSVEAVQHDKEVSVKLIIEGKYTARVIEGCNSISLIVLFISFIIAFSGSLKATFFYSLFGSLLIYTINVLRIAFLTVMIYKYPENQEFLHGLVFPAIIYGTIFMLWVIWVNQFSKFKK
jgi:exosortase family protein XrtF